MIRHHVIERSRPSGGIDASNRLDREAGYVDEPLDTRMAQGVGADARHADTRRAKMLRGHTADDIHGRRRERGDDAKEQMAIGRGRSPVLDVVQDRIADDGGQRIVEWPPFRCGM